jgi:hypothetical protein
MVIVVVIKYRLKFTVEFIVSVSNHEQNRKMVSTYKWKAFIVEEKLQRKKYMSKHLFHRYRQNKTEEYRIFLTKWLILQL